jgi:hypothetical protein
MTTMQQPVRGGFLGERRADDQRLAQQRSIFYL